MARTKGARDKQPRKAKRSKSGRFGKVSVPPAKPVETPTSAGPGGPAGTVADTSEFDRAVDAVLGTESLSREGANPALGSPSPGEQPLSPPPAASDVVLGIDAWEAIIQAPFRSAAIWLAIPAFEQLGKLRGQMLAKPSYPLYKHYVTQWLTDNPEDELFVAKVMTGAAVATVLQEAWIIYASERAKRQAAKRRMVPVDALHTDN